MSNVMLQLDQYCDALMEQEERAQLQAGFAYLNECLEVAGNLSLTCELCRRGPLTKEMFVYLNQGDQLDHAVGTTLVWSDAKASQITYVCLEGLGSGLKAIWDKIVAAFKWIGEVIAKLFKRKKTMAQETVKKIEEVKKTVAEMRKENADWMKDSISFDTSPEDLKKIRDAAAELRTAENTTKFEKDIDDVFKLEAEFLRETTGATTKPSAELFKKIEDTGTDLTKRAAAMKKLYSELRSANVRGKHTLSGRWVNDYIADLDATKTYITWYEEKYGELSQGIDDINAHLKQLSDSAKEKAVSAKAALQQVLNCFRGASEGLNAAGGIADEYASKAKALTNKLNNAKDTENSPSDHD